MATKRLEGRKAIVFGERDDVAGLTVRTCVEAAPADVQTKQEVVS